MPTRRILIALLAAAAAGACTAPPAFAVGNLVDLEIVDRGRGEQLPTYRSRGASWIAGKPGDRYAVRLANRSSGRVVVVLSIDGVNAISGDTAATDQTGYVLEAWETAEITGWRKSDAEAAAFYFTALPDSYAARTDRPENVGVIGAAVFREWVAQPVQRSFDAPALAERSDNAAPAEPSRRAQAAAPSDGASTRPPPPAPSAIASPPVGSVAKADKLGTGHGEREYSPITRTSFTRATARPAEIVQVRYDSEASLVAAGVIVRRRGSDTPRAFPGFVPDPR